MFFEREEEDMADHLGKRNIQGGGSSVEEKGIKGQAREYNGRPAATASC